MVDLSRSEKKDTGSGASRVWFLAVVMEMVPLNNEQR
jgi:hypothetical protein